MYLRENTKNIIKEINMTGTELKIRLDKLRGEVENLGKQDPKVSKIKKELEQLGSLEKRALRFSEEITDPETAIELYSTKQMRLFLAMSEGVCRRIKKGYYATKQRYLIDDLNSDDLQKRLSALKILRFDVSRFKNIDWKMIKFEMIETELDRGFWSF